MDIIKIFKLFPTQKNCIEYLENIRWSKGVYCPYCKSINTHKSTDLERHRHYCNNCKKSFSVTVNTIMHDTRLPLQKWFLAISLIGNAKKSISSMQLSRDLDLPYKTAYSLSQRIRKAMLGEKSPLLEGIIEIDETYIGGKPRYKNVSKRGRGTKKTMVVGMIERKTNTNNGDVIAFPLESINKKQVRELIFENINIEKSEIYSDEFKVYKSLDCIIQHKHINHSAKEYTRGNIHTNSIEGFWSLVKRAYYGQHHHYSKKYTNLYIAEAVFKHNHRRKTSLEIFNSVLEGLLYV